MDRSAAAEPSLPLEGALARRDQELTPGRWRLVRLDDTDQPASEDLESVAAAADLAERLAQATGTG